MLRGVQPTIRPVVSDFWGSASHGLSGGAYAYPGTYACRGSSDVWSLKGLSGGVMLRSYVRCDIVSSEAQIAQPAASRRPPVGGEAIERRPASLTPRDCAPESATSTVNSRLQKNVIAERFRERGHAQLLSGACSVFVLSACPFARKTVKRFCRELWRLSTWRRKYLHRGWPGRPATPADSRPEAATGDGRP